MLKSTNLVKHTSSMSDLHTIQLQILKTLLFNPVARFSDLNISGLTNDHFTFHINQLVKNGYVKKVTGGYELAPKGLELSGRIDITTSQLVTQPKLGVAICLFNGDRVLLNRRLKQQSIGQVGLHTEKVRMGEKLIDTVQRCIKKEIGDIKFQSRFIGISHAQFDTNSELWLDVVLACFRCEYISGEILPGTDEGENLWIEIDKLDKVENLMQGIKDTVQSIQSGNPFLIE